MRAGIGRARSLFETVQPLPLFDGTYLSSNDAAMETPPPPIFDRCLARRRLARAAAAGTEEFLLVHASEEFCERLSSIKRKFSAVLDAGTPSPWLAARLAAGHGPYGRVHRVASMLTLFTGSDPVTDLDVAQA